MTLSLRDRLVGELDHELPFTRAHLERVPGDKLSWKPHATSTPLGHLAGFVAMIWNWGTIVLQQPSFDPVKMQADRAPPSPRSTDEILTWFDEKTKELRDALGKINDGALDLPWTLYGNGQEVFTQPRWLVLRTYVINHAVHHRAQLGVYLRLLRVPVPAVYNDSGDETGGMFR